jgi:multiple sugar transport system substrate-binding protein
MINGFWVNKKRRINEMMKKVISVLLMVSLVFSMTACKATPEKSVEPTNTKEEKTERIEIAFWHNWGSGTAGKSIDESVEAYNNSQDKVTVNPLYIAAEGGDSITSKMLTAVASGNPPEVMFSSRYGIAEYMDSVTILNDLVERDNVDMDALYPWAVDEASYDGQLIAMPYDGTSRALFYNKDHFRAAGLDPENPPKTIEELVEATKKLTIKEGDRIKQFGFVPWLGQGWLYSWGWSFGGSFYNKDTKLVTANDPKIVDALTWMTDLAKETGGTEVSSFASAAGGDANDPFVLGQVSMVVQGNWMTATLDEYAPDLDYGICDIPGPEGVEATTFVGGRALIIPKGITGDKLDAAWDFVKWMCTSEEAQSKKIINREYPVVRSICEEIYKDDEIMQKFLKVLPNGQCRPVILAGNMMWDELAKTPELVLEGNRTPKEILDQITEKINKEVEAKKAKLN